MEQAYDYIEQQFLKLKATHNTDITIMNMIMNMVSDENIGIEFHDTKDVSVVKLSYVLDALSVLDRTALSTYLSMKEHHVIKALFENICLSEYHTTSCIKAAKILSLFPDGISKPVLIKVMKLLEQYLYTKDYLFEKNCTPIICDIIELLIEIRKKYHQFYTELTKQISAYIEVLISYMKDIDYTERKHSFFLKSESPTINAILWEDGDARKSILLLKEGFYNNCIQFKQLGDLISQHLLLISAISKIESGQFGINMGILGIICGFKQLYEISNNIVFKNEEIRWLSILEKELLQTCNHGKNIDIKTWMDISLCYKYLNNQSCKKSKISYQS